MSDLRSFLDRLGRESDSFIGILQCGGEDSGILLFIFQGEPYASALYRGEEIRSFPLEQFQKEMERLGQRGALYATNPVLFKLMLVITQCQPSVVGNSQVINLESLLESIEKGGKEQVLLLKRGTDLNLFYFRAGKLADGYFADPARRTGDTVGLTEALLVYAFEPGAPLEIRVYEDLQVGHSKVTIPIPSPPSEPTSAILQIQLGDRWIEKGVDKDVCVLGRGIKSDCVIDDSSVSREHARIVRDRDGYLIEDLKSRNGTYLEGRRIEKERLTAGSQIRIGAVEVKFLLVPSKPSSESRTGSMERTEVMSAKKNPPVQEEWVLEVTEGTQKGFAFTLSPGKKISLGRGSVDILINDTKVSRHHADIEWVDSGFLYQDLKSTNGSFVNDQPVDQHRLAPGDVLRLGETVLRVSRKR